MAAVIDAQEIVLRLGLALIFGFFIGVEREWRQKHAGLKTIALVSLGAAAFAMMTNTFGPGNHNPGQIAAAVVGGIGFIGAGVIMHRGATVQGVTTAAMLWVAASVGVAAGLGHTTLATILTATILFVQFAGRILEVRVIDPIRPNLVRFELRVDCDSPSLAAVNETVARFSEGPPVHRSVQQDGERTTLRTTLRTKANGSLAAMERALLAIPGVQCVEVHRHGVEDA